MALPHSMPVQLFWLSGLFLLVSTLGVLILTRLVLYLLLILGPVFIIFALFPQTRGLFNGWLRTSLVFALAPLLTVLGGTAALMLFAPLLQAIGDDPQGAVTAVQPMVILFMGSLIYCAFLFVLMWVCASLARDWQATFRERAPAAPAGTASASAVAASSSSAPAAAAQSRDAPPVSVFSRTQEIAAGASALSARAEALGLYDPTARGDSGRAASADRFRRVQGLGQRFRPVRPAAGPAVFQDKSR
jgi:type IV secretion system protein VirB6